VRCYVRTSEIVSEALRQVGFNSFPDSAESFVRYLIEEIHGPISPESEHAVN
jgi:hypothetical protein